jgi:SAM-dependent methyltransferase
MSETDAPQVDGADKNYLWWQQAGWDWYAELSLRRLTKPIYERQERYLAGFFRAKGEEWLRQKGRPLKVLEFGCGFGRHLRYLHQIEGLEVHGCDQSPPMLSVAETLLLGRFPELEDRIRLVEPKGRLPYEDGAFDVVYTVSVLIHVSPEDLQDRVAELRRVARHMVVNLELPSAPRSFLWDQVHEGCWLHNLVEAHRAVGPCYVEVDADSLGPTVAVYSVRQDGPEGATRVLHGGRWLEQPEEVQGALSEAALEYGKSCREQAQETCREVSTQMAQRQAQMTERLVEAAARLESHRQRIRELGGQLRALQQSRAVRAAQWLDAHPWLKVVLKALYDAGTGLRRRLLSLFGLRKAPDAARAAPLAATARDGQAHAAGAGHATAGSGTAPRPDNGHQ